MNKMVLTLALVSGMISCTKEETQNENEYQSSVNKETFGKKEWVLKSIYMNPALIDINGDGIKDAEMISSLPQDERTKTIVFAPDGKVWETKHSSAPAVMEGNWKPDSSGEMLLWIQKNGIILTAKAADYSLNTIAFTYKNDKAEIQYTFQTK